MSGNEISQQLPLSLDGLIQDSIRNSLNSEKLAKKVQDAADKAVSDAIESAFGYGSPFRKGVEAAIKQVLPIVDATDLAQFATATREVLQRRLANLASETAKEHLGELLDALCPEKPVITMAELRSEYIEKLREDASSSDHCHCEDIEDDDLEFTWEVERSGSGITGTYWDLVIAPKPDSYRYDKSTVMLRFRDKEDGLSECWSVAVGKEAEAIKSIFSGPLRGFDAMVFRLATGTAKLQRKPESVAA